MSVAERAYGFVKRIVLLDDKVERLGRSVTELEAHTEDHAIRLVRVETLLGIGVPFAPTPPRPRPPRR